MDEVEIKVNEEEATVGCLLCISTCMLPKLNYCFCVKQSRS